MLQGDFGTLLRAQPPGARRGAGAVQRDADPGRDGLRALRDPRHRGGRVSAANQYGLADKAITFVVLLGISIPSFFLGMMMILLFAVNLRWFPVSGMWPIYGDRTLWALLDHLAMPAIALAVVATGVIARLSRSAMLEVLRQDFIRTARAKGVHERGVIWRHALRAAMVSIIPVLGIQAGFVLSGAVYIEIVFQWPGVGGCWSTRS
jgi:peptide/nickel transport system permease protein